MKNLFYLLIAILIVSCNKGADELPNEIVSQTKLTTVNAVSGINGGVTTESKSFSLASAGLDELFLSQSPLVEYQYNIAIDTEEIFTYELDAITGDTINTTSVINEISRDTLSITSGPIWLPFDTSNEVSLQVGLKKEFINPDLDITIEVNVVDNIPVSSGLLFTSLKYDDVTLATDSDVIITDAIYVIATDIPKYNVNGRVINETDGIVIPRFAVRQFFVSDVDLTREFELTITTSDGSVVVAPFSIKFVDTQIYNDRQCWLNGEPQCKDLF